MGRMPVIQELSDWVTRPEFLYRSRWRAGDLLMWDNCCAQHLAVKDYDRLQRRLMHRVTVNGSVPA
jgi:taurine dioxygenase